MEKSLTILSNLYWVKFIIARMDPSNIQAIIHFEIAFEINLLMVDVRLQSIKDKNITISPINT